MSKCPSSIWHQDLNPQPFEHESSPITTRPGLPPEIADASFNYMRLGIFFGPPGTPGNSLYFNEPIPIVF